MADAFVIAGALMKGPFAAGALTVLSDPDVQERMDLRVRRIVATSSGAISAAFYGAAIQAGRDAHAGWKLAQLWVEEASFARALAPSPRAFLSRQGISSARSLLRIFRRHVAPSPVRHAIELRLVTTNLDGDVTFVAGRRATTHEHVFGFTAEDFTTEARLERVFEVVAASSSFPGLFAPVPLRVGKRTAFFSDGGATNNTPLRYAIEQAADVRRVFVITPTPRVQPPLRPLRGLAYFSELSDILEGERLVRDLAAAEQVNESLAALERAVPEPDLRAEVLRALGWSHRREIEVIEIRPERSLEGNAFSGGFSRRLREDYVLAGREAALRAIEPLSAPPVAA
jgi:predicted acylesterase/phospholipase RssA